MLTFRPFQKIPRLNRNCTISEKLDGTHGQIYIPEPSDAIEIPPVGFYVGSRNRWTTPEADNYGFARWAYENASELLKLGFGQHFGEWWGSGIQRGYGLKEKRFSLFNTSRWANKLPTEVVSTVPVLYEGLFSSSIVEANIALLSSNGSVASPGFMNPEGIVVYLHASRELYKVTCVNDEKPKGSKE